ncbi:MAG: hypothetical protein ABII76_17195 [Pseudomonadota bacterium]
MDLSQLTIGLPVVLGVSAVLMSAAWKMITELRAIDQRLTRIEARLDAHIETER